MKESRGLYTDWIARLLALTLSLMTVSTQLMARGSNTTDRGDQVILSSEEFLTTEFATTATAVYLGNTKSAYLHPFLVRQQLATMVAEKPKDTLHIVALSGRGLAPQLIELMNEKSYLEKKQGKLAVVVSRSDYDGDSELRELAAKADYIIFTSTASQVSETMAEASLRFAEIQERPVSVEVFEGGNLARDTLFNIATRSRFATPLQDIEINSRMNYNSKELLDEGGGLAATEFLGLLKRVKSTLHNVEVRAFLHKEPGVYQSISENPSESFGEEKQVELDSIRITERLQKMKTGRAHRQNQAGLQMGHVANVYIALDQDILSIILVPSDWLRDNIRKNNFRMKLTANGKSSSSDMTGWEEVQMDLYPGTVLRYTGKLTDYSIAPENVKPVNIRLKMEHRFKGSGSELQDYYANYTLFVESGEQVATSHYSYYDFLQAQLKALDAQMNTLRFTENVSLIKPYNDEAAPAYADVKTAIHQYSALIEEVQAELAEIEESNMHRLGIELCEKVFF